MLYCSRCFIINMAKYLHIGLFCLVMLHGACQHKGYVPQEQGEAERFALNELLLLRTEGLILAERIPNDTQNKEITEICDRIKAYYEKTHPDFMLLCEDKIMDVQEEDFDLLWDKIDLYLEEHEEDIESAFLNLVQENIMRSISLYTIIIQQEEWEEMRYFSHLALPDLYNQQEDLKDMALMTLVNTENNHASNITYK